MVRAPRGRTKPHLLLIKMPKTIKAPEGNYYLRTENSLGECGYYLVRARGGRFASATAIAEISGFMK